jgi:outer membrane biosynthesis protein TonB
MPLRSSLLAAGLGALVLAGCGSENSALIPQSDSDRLSALVAEAGELAAEGNCDSAGRAVDEAESQLAGLPRRTDKRLKANLRDWLDHLGAKIASDCEQPEAEETASPEPTESPTEEPPPEETEEPAEPTVEPTAEPSVTVDPGTGGIPSPEEQPDTGGVAPGDG